MAVVLAIVAVVVAHRIHQGEFQTGSDEATHATTGIYVRDLLTDRPIHDPVQYTFRYYAQYPALGLIHWPSLFHFVEGSPS
jgi:hypothetical protein